jgi:hypothetical protein
VSFAGDLSGFIDEELEKLGRKRHVVLAVPQFNGLSTLLSGTDIVATVPDYTADALTPQAVCGRRSTAAGAQLRIAHGVAWVAGQRSGRTLVAVADSDVFRGSG